MSKTLTVNEVKAKLALLGLRPMDLVKESKERFPPKGKSSAAISKLIAGTLYSKEMRKWFAKRIGVKESQLPGPFMYTGGNHDS